MSDKCRWEPERSLNFSKQITSYKTGCESFFNAMAFEYHEDRYDCPEFKYCPFCGKEIEVENE